MKKIVSFSLVFFFFSCTEKTTKDDDDININNTFLLQIQDYLNDCSLQYYKIRAHDSLSVISVYDARSNAIWDSLAILYPDSMEYLVKVGNAEKVAKFEIGENQLRAVPKHLKKTIAQFEIEVEYEVDLGCCHEKICCSYFKFNSDSILDSVEESDFYLSMPRHSKGFLHENMTKK